MAKKKPSHNSRTKKTQAWNLTEAKQFKDINPKERVDLDPFAFERFIDQKGIFVNVFRTTYCPNVKSIDGAEHELDCDMCNGSGFLDVRPIKVRALLQTQNLETMHVVEGLSDGNTVAITFPIGIELQYFTKIELCDFTEIYIQRVARSAGQLDRLKYKALRVNVLVDSTGKEYFEGTDFCLNENGDVVWKNNKGPSPETIYSIHYESRVQFRAIRAMHSNRFSQVKLKGSSEVQHLKFQEQWLCTKEFLVRRMGYDGEELLPNPIPGYAEETPEEE